MSEVSLARIVRPWGRRGEVRAAVLTDFPDRLLKLRRALLGDGKSEPRAIAIRSCRLEPSRRFAIFHKLEVEPHQELPAEPVDPQFVLQGPEPEIVLVDCRFAFQFDPLSGSIIH